MTPVAVPASVHARAKQLGFGVPDKTRKLAALVSRDKKQDAGGPDKARKLAALVSFTKKKPALSKLSK